MENGNPEEDGPRPQVLEGCCIRDAWHISLQDKGSDTQKEYSS